MIFVTQYHASGALHVSVQPERIIAQIIPHPMCFEIRFVNQIDPIFVAQFIPKLMIGIMAGSHRVEVELFHQLDFSAHVIFCERASAFGMMLMTINAAYHKAFAVEKNNTVLDLDLAKTDAATFEINGSAL